MNEKPKNQKKDNVAKWPKGSSENIEDHDAWVLRDAVVYNLKNLIVIGEEVDGSICVLTSAELDEARWAYMMMHAMKKVTERDYEPATLEIEIDDEAEEDLEEADGEADTQVVSEGAAVAGQQAAPERPSVVEEGSEGDQ